jgi:beta-lysine 5,6-aminomutase alpha subunit
MSDRALALDNAAYIEKAFKDFGDEITFNPNGKIVKRAHEVLDSATHLLKEIHQDGLFLTLKKGVFAGISRHENQGKGLKGVCVKHPDYQNPIIDLLVSRLKEAHHE